jgi:hypothetical protein
VRNVPKPTVTAPLCPSIKIHFVDQLVSTLSFGSLYVEVDSLEAFISLHDGQISRGRNDYNYIRRDCASPDRGAQRADVRKRNYVNIFCWIRFFMHYIELTVF